MFSLFKMLKCAGPPKVQGPGQLPSLPIAYMALIRPWRGNRVVFNSVVQEGRLFLALFDLDRKGDSTGV